MHAGCVLSKCGGVLAGAGDSTQPSGDVPGDAALVVEPGGRCTD